MVSKQWDGTIVYEDLEQTVSAEELVAIAEEREYAWVIGEPEARDGYIGLVLPLRFAALDQRGLVNLVESPVIAARRAWGPELFEEADTEKLRVDTGRDPSNHERCRRQ